jgi:phosphatidate phosphatase APP1
MVSAWLRAAKHGFAQLRFQLKLRTGLLAPLEIWPYRGHGTGTRLYLQARVLERSGLVRPGARDSAWRNLRNMSRRFFSSEIPGARVLASFRGVQQELVANDEGYVQLHMELDEPLARDAGWQPVRLELLWPTVRGQGRVYATGKVLICDQAEFGVISDLDDTVVQSKVTSLFTMLRVALLNNAHSRLPFAGVAAFYRALQRGSDGQQFNPVFYVSSSPWNLFDLLEDFLDVHGVPRGPILLRDWSPLTLKGQNERHKLGIIRELLATYPELRFVLIGDSSEHDPEIYRRVVRENTGRVLAIYIRDVASRQRHREVLAIAQEVRALGVDMLIAPDTAAVAAHAAMHGLIDPSAPAVGPLAGSARRPG